MQNTDIGDTSQDRQNGQSDVEASNAPATYEALIYRVVDTYIRRKLKSKHDLEWSKIGESDAKGKDEYSKARAKIGKDAFLSVRSRTGADFADYFASTLCSVSQRLSEDDFVTLATALYAKTDEVRTLTLLALSARS